MAIGAVVPQRTNKTPSLPPFLEIDRATSGLPPPAKIEALCKICSLGSNRSLVGGESHWWTLNYMPMFWLQKRVKFWVLLSRLVWVVPTLLAKLNLYWKIFTKYKDYSKGGVKYECNHYIPPFLPAPLPTIDLSKSCQNLVSTLQCTCWNWTHPVAQITWLEPKFPAWVLPTTRPWETTPCSWD